MESIGDGWGEKNCGIKGYAKGKTHFELYTYATCATYVYIPCMVKRGTSWIYTREKIS